MDENEYPFLCTVTLFWLSKSLEFKFIFFFILKAFTKPSHLKITQRCNVVHDVYVETCHQHIAKPNFAKNKIVKRIWNGRKRIHIFMNSNGFLVVKITKISISYLFNGIYETLPFKNHSTLWCRAWRIRWDMAKPNFAGKILHALDENEYAFLCTVTAFWLSKSLNFNFSFLMVFTKPCHLKITQRCDVVHDV